MFKNYCRSYKYKIIKKNLKNHVELNRLEKVFSVTQSAQALDSLPSTSQVLTSTSVAEQPSLNVFHQNISQLSDSDESIHSTQDLLNEPFDEPGLSSYSDSKFENAVPDTTMIKSSDFLVKWSLKNNITHTALSELLSWFASKPDITNLPKDARTLLKTPTKLSYEVMGSGQFYYFGILEKLQQISNKHDINHLLLDFGVDGLPLHKSTNFSFWPILCRIRNLHFKIFTVAIYYGSEKPILDHFFRAFVEELVVLSTEGLNVDGRIIPVQIGAFCCDAPARAFVKNIKSHNGYSGCDRCSDRGVYCNRRMLFLKLDAPLRTNNDFQKTVDGVHHRGNTPLSALGVGMISNFPVDYMHSVCLGVMRKLLFIWRDGSRPYKFPRLNMNEIDADIKVIQDYWPSEFNRKPRSWEDLERWKATELRQFLLYVGPVIMRDKLPKRMYEHFMLLKFAITILLNESLNEDYNDYAKKLLIHFVSHSVRIYGQDFCIYNTHSLIHLPEDAKQFGSLNVVSCFPFENYLQMLKRLLRKSNNPLQQAVNRLHEVENLESEIGYEKEVFRFIGNPIKVSFNEPSDILNQYRNYVFWKKIIYNGYILSSKCGDAFVMLKNRDIVKIFFIGTKASEKIIFGKKFSVKKPFVTSPTNSNFLMIYEIHMEEGPMKVYSLDNILYKGVVLPYKSNYVFSPLLHLQ